MVEFLKSKIPVTNSIKHMLAMPYFRPELYEDFPPRYSVKHDPECFEPHQAMAYFSYKSLCTGIEGNSRSMVLNETIRYLTHHFKHAFDTIPALNTFAAVILPASLVPYLESLALSRCMKENGHGMMFMMGSGENAPCMACCVYYGIDESLTDEILIHYSTRDEGDNYAPFPSETAYITRALALQYCPAKHSDLLKKLNHANQRFRSCECKRGWKLAKEPEAQTTQPSSPQ